MKKCPVCNGTVPQGHGYKSSQKYCSLKCYQNRLFYNKEQEILTLLNKTDNVTATAELMGIHRATLYAYLKRKKIQRKVVWT